MKLNDISEENIQEIADSSAILARGLDYYERGQIKSMNVKENNISAKVHGSYGTYDVEISIENGRIHADCDCPYDGYGCKHIVAVLYKWLEDKNKKSNKKTAKTGNKEVDLKKEIFKLNKDELAKTLLALSNDYEDVKRDIILKICKKPYANVDIQKIIYRQIEDTLYSGDGFIDYYSVFKVVKRLDEIKESILQSSPDTRTPLLKMLVKKSMEVQNGGCDDSSGSMGEFVIDCLTLLGKSIHEQDLSFEEKKRIIQENFDMIEKEKYGLEGGYINLILEIPSTKEDFEFLVWELKTRIEKQTEDYEKGLYRGILTEAYKKAGNDKEYLTILEENAKKEGDYISLAEFWKEKEEINKAIEIAEKGLRTKTNHWDSHLELFDFLEDIYRSKKDTGNLLRILQLHFKEDPSLLKYKEIINLSKKLNKWDSLKDELVQYAKGEVLIEILLFEKQLEKAYSKLLGSERDYSDKFRDEVAKALIKEFPEKAIKIYIVIVKQFIEGANRDSYKIAALYAKKIRDTYSQTNQKDRWGNYVAKIREENKRRPALIEEFRRL